jgi:hypothetical protein
MAAKLKNPPRCNQAGQRIPPLLDCSPMRVVLKKDGRPFEPTERQIGASVTFDHKGEEITGQVWSLGPYPGSHWIVADSVAYVVGLSGRVVETWLDR